MASNGKHSNLLLHLKTEDADIDSENIKLEPNVEFEIIEIDDQIFLQNSDDESNIAQKPFRSNFEDEIGYTFLSDEIVKEEPISENPTQSIPMLQTEEPLESNEAGKSNLEFGSLPTEEYSSAFECPFCYRMFINQRRLDRHQRVHTNEKPYQCSVCQKTFNRKASLILHGTIHTGMRPFQCTICSCRFRMKQHLERHKCSASASEPTELSERKIIPEYIIGIRTYECYMCGLGFQFNRSQLRKHIILKHTGDILYECELCNKRFLKKYSMVKHLSVHSGGRPFKCQICSKGFITAHDLNRHIQSHGKTKPFQCEFYPKKLSTKKILRTHLKTHTTIKPYECELCHKKFLKNGCLTRHKRTHSGDRPFECNICHRKFSRNHLLTDHKRNIHSVNQ